MSDISLYEHEVAVEELCDMPSETVTDIEDIPDQTALPDFEEVDDVDR